MNAQSPDLRLVRRHRVDTTGEGVVNGADRRVVERSLFTRRGFKARPNAEFDVRADVLGRGIVDDEELTVVSRVVGERPGVLQYHEFRPVTIAWHYGWYNKKKRAPGSQTVRFLDGNYVSSDSEVEGLFHEQKNEFGITVDALSWIAPRDNANILNNYRRGYFQGNQIETRQVALIYESTISLPREIKRVDFLSPWVQTLLVDDFEQMALFLREVRDVTPARIFRLDGRPVIFLFGSHTWGLESNDLNQLDAIDQALQRVRERFAAVFGAAPYLVGEEVLPSFAHPYTESRRRRTVNFDGVFIYHHATNMKPGSDVVLPLDAWYIDNQVKLHRRMYSLLRGVVNRYTGLPILVIPSVAAGFAKPGFPTLSVTRESYSALIEAIRQVHLNEYLLTDRGTHLGTGVLPAAVYSVGSWNEEFEGHSVFPSRFNRALGAERQHGFDIPMAIKQAFGWNHYAHHRIPTQ